MSELAMHSLRSTLRERIVEHVFVGEALRNLWRRGIADVEVLRSEFDAHGYDLIMRGARSSDTSSSKPASEKSPHLFRSRGLSSISPAAA